MLPSLGELRLFAPELSLSVLAFLLIFLDLVIGRKTVLAWLSVGGLVVPAVLSLQLMGNGGVAFSGTLVVDDFAVVFKLLFLGVAALVILASSDYVARFASFQGEYYALVLLSAAGMMLMASTGDLISIYVALETTGIALFVLAGFLKDAKSSEAGLKFLLLGAVSSAVMLYGMALVFGLTGSTNLKAIALALGDDVGPNRATLLLGVVLLVAGFGFKLASVPFQMWVPDVYEGAPTPVTAYLSVASKAAGFAVVLRVFHSALGSPEISVDWSALFAVLSALSMTLGNVVAIAQGNIKRMMGYSSIAHAGYLMMGLAVVPQLGPSGVLFYLVAYGFTNLGAFIAVIAISDKLDSDAIADYAGMARRAPLLALALTIGLVSLTGLPPTAGFIAKIYIFNAAVQDGLVWLVVVAVVNTAVSAYYYLGVVKEMYLGEAPREEPLATPMSLRVALLVAVAGVLALGVYPAPMIAIAESAVSALRLP